MQVGDLVIRKVPRHPARRASVLQQKERLGVGLVISKQAMGKNPVHPCVTVYYPKVDKIYDIAESLVVSLGRG